MFIYVGNLSLEVTENDLKSEFNNFGEVTSVIIMHDQEIGSGQGRTCGYVEMRSGLEGESAIANLQGIHIKGRKLDIIKALPVTRKATSGKKTESERSASGFNRTGGYWGSKCRK